MGQQGGQETAKKSNLLDGIHQWITSALCQPNSACCFPHPLFLNQVCSTSQLSAASFFLVERLSFGKLPHRIGLNQINVSSNDLISSDYHQYHDRKNQSGRQQVPKLEQKRPQLSLKLHVHGVASQVLVELPQFEQFGRVAHVLLRVVATHTTTRTTCSRNTFSHHLSLLRALQDHQFSALLRWLAVGRHRHSAVPAGLRFRAAHDAVSHETVESAGLSRGQRMSIAWLPCPLRHKWPKQPLECHGTEVVELQSYALATPPQRCDGMQFCSGQGHSKVEENRRR